MAKKASSSAFPARFSRVVSDQPVTLPYEHPTGKAKMALADFFPAADIAAIEKHGSISFHAMGDSGVDTQDQRDVADVMATEVNKDHPELGPAFLLHLGDIIYGPNKIPGYVNKFYRANQAYHNLIFGIPGNHDGEVRDAAADSPSLAAFLVNFCQPSPKQPPNGVAFGKLMPNQPGAYWRLTCPFVDIVGLNSGIDENIGVLDGQQATWLGKTLNDIATERKAGTKQALLFAVHHPPYAAGLHQSTGHAHPSSAGMLAQIDQSCQDAGVWPYAVLSAHAHNYQSYLRTRNIGGAIRTIPFLISGGGGIGTQPVQPGGNTISDGSPGGTVRYLGGTQSHGYLTVTVSDSVLTTSFTRVVGTHGDVDETLKFDLVSGKQI
jgi:hypothetical protein